MANAITATIGADIAPLKKEVLTGEQLLKASSKRVAEEAKKEAAASKRLADAIAKDHEEAGKRARDGVKSVVGGLANAGTAGEAVASGFEAIGALGGPIGAVAAASAFIAHSWSVAGEEISAARVQYSELNREMSFRTSANSTAGDLLGAAGRAGEAIRQTKLAKEEALISLGLFGSNNKGTVSNTLLGGLGEHIRDGGHAWITEGKTKARIAQDKREEEARERQGKALSDAATVSGEDLDAAREKAFVSERAGAIAEAELKTRREIAAVERDAAMTGADPAKVAEVTSQIALRGQMEIAQIARQMNAAERAISLESELQGIRADGDNAGVEAARERLDAAREELAAARGKENVDRAQSKVSAARNDLDEAKVARTILLENLAAQKEIAAVTGTDDERHTRELEIHGKLLEANLKHSVKPDDKLNFEAQLAQNKAAQRENEKALAIKAREREFAIANSKIDADQGVGAAAARRAANAKLDAANEHLAALEKGPKTDDQVQQIEAAKAGINQMVNAIDDEAEALRRANANARDETDILAAQVEGRTRLAAAMEVEKEFRDKIVQARRDHNEEQEKELNLQKQAKVAQLGQQRVLGGAGGVLEQMAQARKLQQASRIAAAQDKDDNGTRHRLGDHLLGATKKQREAIRLDLEKKAGDEHNKAVGVFRDALDGSGLARDIRSLLQQPQKIA